MAVQMQVAFSGTLSGAGSIAGGIYWCAEGDLNRAQTTCMSQPAGIHPADQIAEAKKLETTGEIDPTANLANHKVYLYASPQDMVINPLNTDKLKEFYQAFLDGSRIHVENGVSSAHGFPTLDFGNLCTMGMVPWLLKCGYDAAGEILKTLYGSLHPRAAADPSRLIKFDQTAFGGGQTSLYPEGWIYVPKACAGGASCRLHLALHGCQMNPDFVQDQFVKHSGYNEWAESNAIAILYPQVAKSGNAYACWDWFGYTGANYGTKNGAQMSALKKMIDAISR
jgi:Esterase PHB depolymerase